MKIVVFGSTGGTGKNVVDVALAAGHDVVACARRPEAVTQKHDKLTVKKADAGDAASVAAAISGADAVVIAVGPKSGRDPGTVISDCARNVVAAAKQHGVKRVVLESGIMMSDGSDLSLVSRMAIGVFGAFLAKLKADKKVAEDAMTSSGLEWIIVRPPNLEHTPAKGGYTAAPRARIFPAKALSHADCAAVLVKAATTPDWVGAIVNVGYP